MCIEKRKTCKHTKRPNEIIKRLTREIENEKTVSGGKNVMHTKIEVQGLVHLFFLILLSLALFFHSHASFVALVVWTLVRFNCVNYALMQQTFIDGNKVSKKCMCCYDI